MPGASTGRRSASHTGAAAAPRAKQEAVGFPSESYAVFGDLRFAPPSPRAPTFAQRLRQFWLGR